MRVAKRFLIVVPAVALALMRIGPSEAWAQETGASVPIPGQYIVVLRDSVVDPAMEANILSAVHHGTPTHVYVHALKGFVVKAMPEVDAMQLSFDPQVEFVEQDRLVHLPQIDDVEVESPAPPEIDSTWWRYSWGLDRIDQRDLPLDGSYYSALTGLWVDAYVIDTGIRSTHVDFGGRVAPGWSVKGGTDDCFGHGTHVAGTLGGSTWGVAKQVTLVPVKVYRGCGGYAYVSDTIAGVEWVTKDHVAGQPAVANMSLIYDWTSDALDKAVGGSIADGISYVVAAGNNEGQNACGFSPARVLPALTVAASTITDYRAEFSNIGPCVDLFAPGERITSAWWTSDTATHVMDGTSMASPHVAGAAALYLQMYPTASPSEVSKALIHIATRNRIHDPGTGTPNLLLFRPGR